jgi:hypothetical protein
MNVELTMPTEEVVGRAIDVLVSVLDGKRVATAKVTAAAALLNAYAVLRPLEKRAHEIPQGYPYGRGTLAPKISPPPGVHRVIS